jgi:hypothetical protein
VTRARCDLVFASGTAFFVRSSIPAGLFLG